MSEEQFWDDMRKGVEARYLDAKQGALLDGTSRPPFDNARRMQRLEEASADLRRFQEMRARR